MLYTVYQKNDSDVAHNFNAYQPMMLLKEYAIK